MSAIHPEMLLPFRHNQRITRKWIRWGERWILTESQDIRQWSDEKKIWITEYMKEQIHGGGCVICAFDGDTVIGFSSADGILFGDGEKYANLTMLFVDDAWHGQGIGRKLFASVCGEVRQMGADRLFISAIPSADTVAFYRAVGCRDAAQIIPAFIDTEEDYYLEKALI